MACVASCLRDFAALGGLLASRHVAARSRVLLALVLVSALASCTQLWPWMEVRKPWTPSAIAKASLVRAREVDGTEVTLCRAAILEEPGRAVLVGREWNSRLDPAPIQELELSGVERLEERRTGPAAVGTSAAVVLGLIYILVPLFLILHNL